MGRWTTNLDFSDPPGFAKARCIWLHVDIRWLPNSEVEFVFRTPTANQKRHSVWTGERLIGEKRVNEHELVADIKDVSSVFEKHSTQWPTQACEDNSIAFLEDLETPCARLTKRVLPLSVMNFLQSEIFGKEFDFRVLCIVGNSWLVPWELLSIFDEGRNRVLLCESACVVRIDIDHEGQEDQAPLAQDLIGQGVVGGYGWPCESGRPGSCDDAASCLDGWKADGIPTEQVARKKRFGGIGSTRAVFQVIAHADAAGNPMLSDRTCFAIDDLLVHPVGGPGTLVCLHCCGSASSLGRESSFAAKLHRARGAAVAASMMEIPRSCGCRIAHGIARSIREGRTRWIEIFHDLKNSEIRSAESSANYPNPFWRAYAFWGDWYGAVPNAQIGDSDN